MKPKNQQIKFLLETDYDHFSVTPSHRSKKFEMGEHGERLLTGRKTSFLPLSFEKSGLFPTYRSREVQSLEFTSHTILADQGQTNRSNFYWKQITIVVPWHRFTDQIFLRWASMESGYSQEGERVSCLYHLRDVGCLPLIPPEKCGL